MAIETIKLGGFLDEEVAKINANFAQCCTEMPDVPTKVSQLTNDSQFQTATQVQTTVNNAVGAIDVPSKTSDLTNDSGFITSSALNNYVTKEAGKGLYPDTDAVKVGRLGKIDFTTSNFTQSGTSYQATLAAAGKYPVKVMRQSGSEYEEVLVHTKVSGNNIVIVSSEAFSGYVVTI